MAANLPAGPDPGRARVRPARAVYAAVTPPPQELAVANRHDAAVPALEAFLTAQGRRKFVRPLFNALAADAEWGRPIARRLYPGVRPLYHPVTASAVDALDLGVGARA